MIEVSGDTIFFNRHIVGFIMMKPGTARDAFLEALEDRPDYDTKFKNAYTAFDKIKRSLDNMIKTAEQQKELLTRDDE